MKLVVYDLGSIVDWISAIGTIGTLVFAIYLLFRDEFGKLDFYNREMCVGFNNEETIEKMIEKSSGGFYYEGNDDIIYPCKEALVTLDGVIGFDLYNRTSIYKTLRDVRIGYTYGNVSSFCKLTDMEGNEVSILSVGPRKTKYIKLKFSIKTHGELSDLKDNDIKFYLQGVDERGRGFNQFLIEHSKLDNIR